jgi:hypothetical protein
MKLRPVICALRGHKYAYGGIVLGNRLDRCSRCGKVKLSSVGKPGTLVRLRGPRR